VIIRSHIVLAIIVPLQFLYTAEALAGRDEAIERIHLEAFSILPPGGTEWQARSQPAQFEAGRLLDGNPLHTFVLKAKEYPPSPAPVDSLHELLLAVQAAAEKESRKPGRFKLTSHEVVEATRLALECVEYRKRWNDQAAPNAQGTKLLMGAHGLICIHPQARHRLIEVSYSYRSATGSLTTEQEHEGVRFLESVRARQKVAPGDESD